MSVECNGELYFYPPFTTMSKETMTVHNPNAEPVIFKVKTTAPKQYCVRPNSGRIEANSSLKIQVLLQAFKEEPPVGFKCRDKFLIQSMLLGNEDTQGVENYHEFWAAMEKRPGVKIHDRRIRCVFSTTPSTAAGENAPQAVSDATTSTTAATATPAATAPAPVPAPAPAPAPVPAPVAAANSSSPAVPTSIPSEPIEVPSKKEEPVVKKEQVPVAPAAADAIAPKTTLSSSHVSQVTKELDVPSAASTQPNAAATTSAAPSSGPTFASTDAIAPSAIASTVPDLVQTVVDMDEPQAQEEETVVPKAAPVEAEPEPEPEDKRELPTTPSFAPEEEKTIKESDVASQADVAKGTLETIEDKMTSAANAVRSAVHGTAQKVTELGEASTTAVAQPVEELAESTGVAASVNVPEPQTAEETTATTIPNASTLGSTARESAQDAALTARRVASEPAKETPVPAVTQTQAQAAASAPRDTQERQTTAQLAAGNSENTVAGGIEPKMVAILCFISFMIGYLFF
ncbi:MSP domain-containing protein [Schizosaccharomyces japonicus yFS275]|uniref:MSP domain-containing protein n=1 Tax=Schizosaccharomyces japonicus (strain yFS275 / FY16936) TaxID=402676 RepID=B6K3I5_SCHJY|nr:MSP domain-containing protein [Schizosaccharomyces japonicus yFS275]EEB08042.1 MSP domain-containing protein [Schizosaccharomyces japonicus yFS275]